MILLNNPKYVKINDKKYAINTDFRIAIECEEIAEDKSIDDYERALAIIYKLFGEEGLNDIENYEKLLELGQKYLSCGKEIQNTKEEDKDMSFKQDYDLIKTSFRSDYGINLDNEKMHWWEFYSLLNGLSNSELGNCCILNRVRNIRNMKPSEIKDNKERQKLIEAQRQWALKKNEPELTEEQLESIRRLDEIIGRM